MTGSEIVQQADICALARALGFNFGRSNRAACLLCRATHPPTLSVRPETMSWRCFRCGRSGGVLDPEPLAMALWLAACQQRQHSERAENDGSGRAVAVGESRPEQFQKRQRAEKAEPPATAPVAECRPPVQVVIYANNSKGG